MNNKYFYVFNREEAEKIKQLTGQYYYVFDDILYDYIYLKKKYGSNISLSRAMYPQGHDPRYELRASRIIFNDKVVSYAE